MFATRKVTAESFSIVGAMRTSLPRAVLECSLEDTLTCDWGYGYDLCDSRTLHGAKGAACVDACPVDCVPPKKNPTYDGGPAENHKHPVRYVRDSGLRFFSPPEIDVLGSIVDKRKDSASDHPAFRTVLRLIPTGAVSASSRVVWCSSDSN